MIGRRVRWAFWPIWIAFVLVAGLVVGKAVFFYRAFGQSPAPIVWEFVTFFFRTWFGGLWLVALLATGYSARPRNPSPSR